MNWLLSRPVIIAIAVVGGVAALAAMALQARGSVSRRRLDKLNRFSYVCMGLSITLFVVSGLLGP